MKKLIFILAFVMLYMGVANAIVWDNATSYWHLDNSTVDSIGTHNASIVGAVFNFTNVVNNQSLSLYRNNNELNLSTLFTMNKTKSWSFSAWVNFNDLDQDNFVVSSKGDGANRMDFYILKQVNNTLYARLTKGNVGNVYVYSINPINSTDKFYHIAFTYNGTLINGVNTTMKLYLDGELQDTDFFIYTDIVEIGHDWVVGHNYRYGSSELNGTVDEISMFEDYVLTDSEVLEIYNEYYTIPNQAPVVSVSSPANNTQTNVNEAVLFTVTDDNASSLVCSLYIDSSLNSTNSSVLNNTLTSFNPSWAEGLHSFYVNCTDGELNGISGTYYFYYDSDDPVIQTSLPFPSNTTIFTGYIMNIVGNATNINLSNVSITILYPNSSLFYANETLSFSDPTFHSWDWGFNTTTEPNGVWSIYIYASDQASNSNDRYISFTVANCVPDWQCSNYAACNASDLAPCNETTDLNTCGLVYSGDYSVFADQPCDYCSGDFVEDNRSDCIDNIQVACYTDQNFATCCDITNDLVNDCLFGVVQESGCQNESCGGYTADYDSGDIAPASINAIGVFIIIFGMFVPLIIIGYLGYLGWRKVKLMKK